MFNKKTLTDDISYGKYLDFINRNNAYYIGKYFEKINLNKSEYKYLIHIYIEEGICQDDLVTMLRLDKYEVAKGIKSLVTKGYVYKIKDEKDKRKHRLYLEDKAKEIKPEFINILKNSSDILINGFTENEKEMLQGFLIRMAENIYNEASKLKEKQT